MAQITPPFTPTTFNQATKQIEWKMLWKLSLMHYVKIKRGNWCHVIYLKMLLLASCCTESSERLMVLFIAINLDWSQRDLSNIPVLIFMTRPAQWSNLLLCMCPLYCNQIWFAYPSTWCNNTFLQGSIDEEFYMAQPQGFEDTTYWTHICRLYKAIYGLKQAPRAWYNELKNHFLMLGFINSNSSSTLFIRHHSHATVYLLLYVEDIVINGNDTNC